MIESRHFEFLCDQLAVDTVEHSGRTLWEHLKGTHDLLEEWGAPEHVKLAGLYHSVYGTRRFRHACISTEPEDRGLVRDQIGEEAENLVYVFCVADRPRAFLELIGRGKDLAVEDHVTGGMIELDEEELSELLEIETANLLEQNLGLPHTWEKLMRGPISAGAYAALALRAKAKE